MGLKHCGAMDPHVFNAEFGAFPLPWLQGELRHSKGCPVRFWVSQIPVYNASTGLAFSVTLAISPGCLTPFNGVRTHLNGPSGSGLVWGAGIRGGVGV